MINRNLLEQFVPASMLGNAFLEKEMFREN
jgi:hypothetical protein